MSDPRSRIVNGVLLAAMGGLSFAAGAVSGSSAAYLFGGITVVAGVAEIAYGVWRKR